ncbi:MAG: thioredoxin [Candidatus Cloacimonetes bacterium]|jgi:thioredoxin 1|nr:thioredoxin [Candidatus Cloacimonadota bacterium]
MLEVTADTFEQEVLKSDIPVVIDLWASWCGPCKAIAPIVESIAVDYEGKVKVVKLNIDDHPSIAAQYKVMSIPTLLFFKDGKVESQVIGLVGKDKIAGKIEAML